PEPSLHERVSKLLRRSPRLLPRAVASFAVVLVVVAACVALSIWQRVKETRHQVEVARERGRGDHEWRDAAETLQKADRLIGAARFQLATKQAHELATAPDPPVFDLYHLRTEDWRAQPRFTRLGRDYQQWLEGELGELLYLMARAKLRAALGCTDEAGAKTRL